LLIALPLQQHGCLPGTWRQEVEDVVEVNVLRRRVVGGGVAGTGARIILGAVVAPVPPATIESPMPVIDRSVNIRLAAVFVMSAVEGGGGRCFVTVAAVLVIVDSDTLLAIECGRIRIRFRVGCSIELLAHLLLGRKPPKHVIMSSCEGNYEGHQPAGTRSAVRLG
jgi:hypothetical protein